MSPDPISLGFVASLMRLASTVRNLFSVAGFADFVELEKWSIVFVQCCIPQFLTPPRDHLDFVLTAPVFSILHIQTRCRYHYFGFSAVSHPVKTPHRHHN